MNKSLTPAHAARKARHGVSNARRSPRDGCALRLVPHHPGDLLGRPEFLRKL
ncbi:MAG: hypothetical protein J0L58_17655 [Burkholderiales bacterium]|nr:hypothetical protein [Burkholderiales bacterium]